MTADVNVHTDNKQQFPDLRAHCMVAESHVPAAQSNYRLCFAAQYFAALPQNGLRCEQPCCTNSRAQLRVDNMLNFVICQSLAGPLLKPMAHRYLHR